MACFESYLSGEDERNAFKVWKKNLKVFLQLTKRKWQEAFIALLS